MPTYEYKCDACGHEFERFQPITAQPIRRCPQCGKAKVRRLISTGAGLIFKGSGFYITDYRDKSYADKAKAESGTGGTGGTGGATGGDAKSDGQAREGGGEKKAENNPAETKASGDAAKAAAPTGEPKPSARSD